MLSGRETEVSLLVDLLAGARAGRAGVLQLVGEAGVGKTTLLADVLGRADGFRVLHAVGVHEESQIAYAGLSALLRPVQELLVALPPVQAAAAAAALGLEPGSAAGELLVGAACLQLLALAAEQSPVLLIADDLQWWDDASWRALSFAVRRIGGENIAVVVATRPYSGRQIPGVPTVQLSGLDEAASMVLVRDRYPDTTFDVCRTLSARTGGNALALIEAAHGLVADQRRGAAALPESLPTSNDMESYFSARTASLSTDTRRLLLLAALEGRGDLAVLAAAASRQGLDVALLSAAEQEGLLVMDERRLSFRHPLVAAAVLSAASPSARRAGHAVLAAVTAGESDRAAWHAAAACLAPDPQVAAALADVGIRVLRAAAPAAASAAFERAAALTSDASTRAQRLLLAAEAALVAGATARAELLAVDVKADLLPATDRGRPALVRGRAAMLLGRPGEAGPLLREAADGLGPRDGAAALAEAVEAALESGDVDFARQLVARAERAGSGSDPVLRLHVDRGRCAVQQALGDLAGTHQALRRSIEALDDPETVGSDPAVWLALGSASCQVGDLAAGRRRFMTGAAHARGQGDLPLLIDALAGETFAELSLGSWTSAYATGTRALELMDQDRAPSQVADLLLILAEIDAARGSEELCRRRCHDARAIAERLGLRQQAILAERREALLDLGLNRLDAAAERLERVRRHSEELGLRHPYLSAVPDLVEIYVRAGRAGEAAGLVAEYAARVGPDAPPSAYARLLRTRALIAGADQYPALFDESVRLDADTGLGFFRARTLLCFGERLRRDRMRVAARSVLRSALVLFDGLEATPWSRRTAVELEATGETAGTSSPAASTQLTPQELQIAVLVGEGQRNKDIASTLFLSVRTVEFHLTRVYRKLSVGTRAELASRLVRGGVPAAARPDK